MNEDQIDQLFFKLNYQSRFTLASSHHTDTTSPLLSLSQRHSIYTTRYLESERCKRKSQQKYKEDKRRSNNITIEEDECILIEDTDDFQVQLSEEQQAEEQSGSFQFINRNEDEKNWIKIEQDNEKETDSLFKPKIVYQEPHYQQSQNEQSRREDMAYSSKYPTKQKQLFVETGVYLSKEMENGPNMTRNYTFGNNLNQNTLFQVVNKPKEIHQRKQQQKLIWSQELQFQNQTKNNTIFSLTLQVIENDDGSEDVNKITSPKFADLASYQTNKHKMKNEHLIDNVNSQHFNKIQTPKIKTNKRQRSSKKHEKNTSPKSSKSHSSKSSSKDVKQSLKKSHFVNEMTQSKKDAIVIEQNQQPYEQQRQKAAKKSPALNKSRIYDQSIHKIDSIMNFLPPKLKNTYSTIKEQLLEKQRDFKQKLQLQNKKIKVLKTLIQLEKLGPKLQDFILQQSNTQQQTIILNKIILRLVINQLAKQNIFFHSKEQF